MTALEKLKKRIEILEPLISNTVAGQKLKARVDLLKRLLPKKTIIVEKGITKPIVDPNLTIKQLAQIRVRKLNDLNLKFFKDNLITATKHAYSLDGITYCNLYSAKTKKSITIKTSVLFNNEKFIQNPNLFFENYERLKAILPEKREIKLRASKRNAERMTKNTDLFN